ncbi:MAG: hypothetical protein U0M42_02555 [Acutalibacteraceae bacterium]|nr:hypothetical protein [Acutalibacteraceae bacterium]
MVQNLKVDVIYYNTPADFEFEFNLGGCCPSRILNNRTSSPAEMLTALSKSVSRSRIILVIGKVNEEDGLMAIISKAIGMPLTEVNTEEFSVVYPQTPVVIKNALPLISNDGILAGCIVESGPQAIVLLPDSKSLRKEICETLVFPYVTAMSKTPETDNVMGDEEKPEEENTQEIAEEEQENTEETYEVQTEEADVEPITEEEIVEEVEQAEELPETEISDSENETEENETQQSSFFNDEEENEASLIDDNYVFTKSETEEEAANDYTEDENDDATIPKKKLRLSGLSIAILAVIVMLLVVAAALLYILVYEPSTNAINVMEYIKEVFNFS